MLYGFSSRFVCLHRIFTDWSMGDRDVGQNLNSFNIHLMKMMLHIFCIAILLMGLPIEFIDNNLNKVFGNCDSKPPASAPEFVVQYLKLIHH